MKDKKCFNCVQKKSCSDSFVAWMFFVIGLIATVAVRIVTVLIGINLLYGKIAWYIGVGGFLVFFMYKFSLNRSTANIIDKENLIGLANERKNFSEEQYNLIAAILCNLRSEKERINYFFIFAISAVALLVAMYFDFLK